MRDNREKRARKNAWRFALFLFAAGAPAPLLAQYIGGNAPPPPAAPVAGTVETPAAALSRNLRLIAQSPRNFDALVAAGRAALGLGDFQAAVGFFGRAEEVRPTDPAPKIGMGAASVQMGDPGAALRFFVQAQQLGASASEIGADRGMAHDLNGNQATAQADYRAALSGPHADEARRRLALSLGITGDRNGAFEILNPLLMRRDPSAARVRAFVLALLGDRQGARSAIETAMPGSAARIDPFFAILPNLTPEQKAAAVHLGVFPTASEIRLASAAPVSAASSAPVSTQPRLQQPASTLPRSSRRMPKPTKVAVGRRVTLPPQPIQPVATPVVTRAPIISQPVASAPVTTFELPSSTLAAVTEQQRPEAPDRLSGIDKLLADVAEAAPPPAPRPKVERPDPAVAKAARDRKAADARKAAEAKKAAAEKAEREALGVPGTHWVQLAGGSHADRMPAEYKKISAKSSAFRRRAGHVSQGKDYFRLLVGPFDSKSEAQEFVNTIAKDGVDGFSWTRTPAAIKIEKISTR